MDFNGQLRAELVSEPSTKSQFTEKLPEYRWFVCLEPLQRSQSN